MSITVQQLVDEVRLLSNLRRSTYFSDIDISEFIADGGREIADIFIAAYEHYFQTSVDFTLAGGSGGNTMTLPDDFQKANVLLRLNGTSEPSVVRMLGNLLERASTDSALWGPGGRRYFIADQTLEILPSALSQGDYRLLYTPQFPNLAFPRTPDATAAVRTKPGVNGTGPGGSHYNGNLVFAQSGTEPGRSFAIDPNPGQTIVINGVTMVGGADPITNPTSHGTIVLIANQNDPNENGLFVCRESDPGGTTFFRLETATGLAALGLGTVVSVTGGDTGSGYWRQTTDTTEATVDTAPLLYEEPSLPVVLTPWQRYLKVYAALTIRRARMQDASDLVAEMEGPNGLKKRAEKMAANRTEDPTQAPITHGGRGRGWWGIPGASW